MNEWMHRTVELYYVPKEITFNYKTTVELITCKNVNKFKIWLLYKQSCFSM